MNNKLFVTLAWATTNESLRALFETVGTVTEATVIMDKMNGRSKGFGFVTMSSEAEAAKAIEVLHETELDGRKITVSYARPQEPRN